ncbi:VanW family protein [Paenibacillus flagellatus]|uniref:G5 domain-containing protein n=1 Tax=Paenibacillus flagellatus TaxID=2211139 RepID=A0A2V5JWM4_9BACL|nr:VanW family protein [Paenibacillus flagellatus]PYI51199.1 hypothetical protein DLM86_26300 [Paenibacillus flagellatus]
MKRRTVNRLLAAAVAGLSALWIWFWWYSGLQTLPAGVRLGDWQVGGMRAEEAKLALEDGLKRLSNQKVSLGAADAAANRTEFTMERLGLSSNGEQLSTFLDSFAKEGSRLDRARRRWQLRHAALPLELTVSEEKLRQTLEAAWPGLMKPVTKNAERVVTADDRIEYKPEVRARTADTAVLAGLLVESARDVWDGRLRPDRWTGDASPAKLDVPLRDVLPEMTLDRLKAQGVDRKIAEFTTTSHGSAPGRVHNIQATASTIHDMLLAPGAKFDYGTVIRETERKHGYREAPVIYNGKLVQGIGGGICQVSTTLYNAVLRAGLTVNERRNHSLPVSYVALGQDATFANGYINFVFTNNSGHHLLIRTETNESSVTVKLFGRMPESVTYEVESNVIKTIEPPVKYVHNPSLPKGAQSLLQPGKPGYVVETYRIRKENGAVVGRERVSTDTYQPQPSLVAANNGTPPEDKDGPPGGGRTIIEDGVSGPVLPKGR